MKKGKVSIKEDLCSLRLCKIQCKRKSSKCESMAQVLLKAEAPPSKNEQDAFFTSYRESTHCFFSATAKKHLHIYACTASEFLTHAHIATTRWWRNETSRESSQSCAHNYLSCIFAIIVIITNALVTAVIVTYLLKSLQKLLQTN